MTIDKTTLNRLSQMACLSIDEQDEQTLGQEVNAIMTFIEQIKSTDTKALQPLFHPFDLHQRLRDDVATEESCIEALEAIAPLFEDGHYLVPKVIEQDKS